MFGFVRFDCPWGRNVEAIWFEFFFAENDLQTEATLLFSGSETIGLAMSFPTATSLLTEKWHDLADARHVRILRALAPGAYPT